jgi:hypothetical protein
MLTRIQENIITELMNDNSSIVNDMNLWIEICNHQAAVRAHSIINYCNSLFLETVYEATNTAVDYIQERLVYLMNGILEYRSQYTPGTVCYNLFNSLFDKTAEAFNEFTETY